MARRSGFYTIGLYWDLLRFFLIFAFLAGNGGTTVIDGNFFIILLGISGQPALIFLWRLAKNTPYKEAILPAVRFPGIVVELLAILLFFSGNLPGQGENLLFDNRVFPGGIGLLLLLFILLTDIIFQLILLRLNRKET